MIDRRGLVLTMASLTMLAAVAVFLPWADSGHMVRSGWELATTTRRLDVAESAPQRWMVAAVLLLPAIASATLLAALRDRWIWATLGAMVAGLVVILGSAAVLRSPLSPRFGLVVGVTATGLGAILAVIVLAGEATHGRRRGVVRQH